MCALNDRPGQYFMRGMGCRSPSCQIVKLPSEDPNQTILSAEGEVSAASKLFRYGSAFLTASARWLIRFSLPGCNRQGFPDFRNVKQAVIAKAEVRRFPAVDLAKDLTLKKLIRSSGAAIATVQ